MSEDCIAVVSHSAVKVEERGRKAVFRNKNKDEFSVVRIDGCLVKNGKRADYLIKKKEEISAIVELKGSDVAHACDQLFASVEHEAVTGLLKGKLGFLIVCRRVPRFDSAVAKAKQRASQKYKAGLHIVVDQREMDIEQVAAINGRI